MRCQKADAGGSATICSWTSTTPRQKEVHRKVKQQFKHRRKHRGFSELLSDFLPAKPKSRMERMEEARLDAERMRPILQDKRKRELTLNH